MAIFTEFVLGRRYFIGQLRHQGIQQVAGFGTVDRGDGVRFAHPQLVKFRCFLAQGFAVSLINHEEDGRPGIAVARALAAAQNLRHLAVRRGDPADRVHQKEDGIRFLDREFGLRADIFDEIR